MFNVPQTTPVAKTLHAWQQTCLDKQIATHRSGGTDFVVGAGVGSGKTFQALTFAKWGLDLDEFQMVIVLVPRGGIRDEWINEAKGLGINLSPALSSSDVRRATEFGIPSRLHGFVLTYQLLSGLVNDLKALCLQHKILLAVDEGHHLSEENLWGASVMEAGDDAVFRLGLSGTPYRSDATKIPLLHYEDGVGLPHHNYSYGEALDDGVVAPVGFRFLGGTGLFTIPKLGLGQTRISYATDYGDNEKMLNLRQNLFLEESDEWLDFAFDEAHKHLCELRQRDNFPWGGLAVFNRVETAKALAERMRKKHGIKIKLIVADEKTGEAVKAFNESKDEWVFSITKIAEGINIPRLRVLSYLSTVTSRLFFDQVWGRVIRLHKDFSAVGQFAAVFLPADPRLKAYVEDIREMVKHALEKSAEKTEVTAREIDLFEQPTPDGEPEFVVVHEISGDMDGLACGDELFSEEEVERAVQYFRIHSPNAGGLLPIFQQVQLYNDIVCGGRDERAV